jgi:hypothetical protein
MKIIINNTSFEYDLGCKLLKSKNGDKCPVWFNQPEIWDDIEPITFKEIATSFNNIEQRRIAIDCLGLDNLVKEVNPILIGSETIKKTTTYIDQNGELVTENFDDTYSLYEVTNESLGMEARWNGIREYHYIKCKDTSTDREYLIWIDAPSVYLANNPVSRWISNSENYGRKITPIQAIAWTIQTNIEKGGIEKMIRQGDCVLIKKNKKCEYGETRHITEQEYRELLVLES